MHSKTFTIELPYENPLPPEHFEIIAIDVESNSRAINFNLKKYPRAVEMASNVFEDVKKEFSVRALATDGVTAIYAEWDTDNIAWSGWMQEENDEPLDVARANYWREVDALAKKLYAESEGNVAWFDCLERAETDLSLEINEAAGAQ